MSSSQQKQNLERKAKKTHERRRNKEMSNCSKRSARVARLCKYDQDQTRLIFSLIRHIARCLNLTVPVLFTPYYCALPLQCNCVCYSRNLLIHGNIRQSESFKLSDTTLSPQASVKIFPPTVLILPSKGILRHRAQTLGLRLLYFSTALF